MLIRVGELRFNVRALYCRQERRSDDYFSPGGKAGLRPDRAVIVYANRAREAFGKDTPVIIGGLEASLRRFAHYDYWDDKVRRSVLFDSRADMLVYGTGEKAILEIAASLKCKVPVSEMKDIPGTAYISDDLPDSSSESVELPSFEEAAESKRAYSEATRTEYDEHDPVRGRRLVQRHGDKFLVVNPPAMPLGTKEFDYTAELP